MLDLFFEKLLKHIDAAVIVTDGRGNIAFANDKFLEFFNFSEKEIVGKYWINNVIPESKRPIVQKVFANIKSKKMLGQFDMPTVAVGDMQKYLCWVGVPLKQSRRSYYVFIGRECRPAGYKIVKVHDPTSKRLNKAYREIVIALFAASRVNDPETADHSNRVMSYAAALAGKLKIGKKRIQRLKLASLLHDLGKLLVDEKIMFKKGKLTRKEFEEIKRHPQWGADVVRLIYFLKDIVPIMESHHENFNGSGYPRGMKGEKIPLETRILTVVDIFEALTSDRPYRKAFSCEDAVKIMREERGRKLDPELTDTFLELVKTGELKEEEF